MGQLSVSSSPCIPSAWLDVKRDKFLSISLVSTLQLCVKVWTAARHPTNPTPIQPPREECDGFAWGPWFTDECACVCRILTQTYRLACMEEESQTRLSAHIWSQRLEPLFATTGFNIDPLNIQVGKPPCPCLIYSCAANGLSQGTPSTQILPLACLGTSVTLDPSSWYRHNLDQFVVGLIF